MLHIWRRLRRLHASPQPTSSRHAWEKPPTFSSKDVLKQLSPSAVKAFLKIRELWELRDEDARQLLGGISQWCVLRIEEKKRVALDQDRLTRISILTGYFKGLNILYSKKLADRWINCQMKTRCLKESLPLPT